MFEDNPLDPSPFVLDTNDFTSFADLDPFSSSSSRHPSPSFPTIVEPQSDLNNLWFNFSNVNDDLLNPKFTLSQPITNSPWDFLTFSNVSPDSGSTSTSGGLSPPFTIDPQLMATPTTSKSLSDFGDDDVAKDEHSREEEDDDEDDEGPLTPPPIRPTANKGKDRRPVVHSGGIQKKVHISSVVKTDPLDSSLDDWRPSPEEYQKMSSREKRQLRNKISARNFRNRRKEYISTLENDVAERDRLIDAIRAELGSTKSENAALQQEIKALKKALLGDAGRASLPVLPPPSPLPISAPAPRTTASSSSLLTPNLHKDLPSTSPRLAAKAFWGGNSPVFGGVTPVHTVTIPDLLAGATIKSPALQENINPSLNNSNATNSIGLATLGGPGKPALFDTFADSNPFTMKMLDAYRMQLWTRMAQQQQQQQQQQPKQPSSPSAPPLTGLAAGLRPHYFSSAAGMRSPSVASPTLSSLLSGKHQTPFTHAHSTPPSSPKLGATSASATLSPTPQQAALATMASQTLMQRLGSAFWQAFSGSSSSPSSSYSTSGTSGPSMNPRVPAWDADKIRRVLEGTAVVRVVDVEPPSSAQGSKSGKAVAKDAKEVQAQVQPASSKGCEAGFCVLEESMRALTLGKK
ncbi:hypothetical protein F5148DRAFT_1239278 [Russula earlei]|uniref:Uncharacterized protein n=1 Tax=Russula earlei TaxID=71964 RepID=A0ACC0TWU7_9AGAM|nr:hypothetical protein F5148DRAFT_1239278 [Russula earlei]